MTRPLFGGGRVVPAGAEAPAPADARPRAAAEAAPATPGSLPGGPLPGVLDAAAASPPAAVRTFHGVSRPAEAPAAAAPAMSAPPVRTFHDLQRPPAATGTPGAAAPVQRSLAGTPLPSVTAQPAPAVRTFQAEQHRAAVPPKALFSPSIQAELPADFLAALAQLPRPPEDAQQQRTVFRLLKDLEAARDEDILQFGEAPAAAVDALLKQALAIMIDPDLPRVGALLKETLDDLGRVRPQAKPGWLQRLTRSPASWLQALDRTLDARLQELARLEQEVLVDAGRLLALIEQNEDQFSSLASHHWACSLAEPWLAHRPPATRERLARRAQLLYTLRTSADMTRRQLEMSREHLLGVAERVQTLRFATLPLWRQQFLAPLQSQKELAAGDAQALDTHHQLMDQLGQLVTLTSRKVYD